MAAWFIIMMIVFHSVGVCVGAIIFSFVIRILLVDKLQLEKSLQIYIVGCLK